MIGIQSPTFLHTNAQKGPYQPALIKRVADCHFIGAVWYGSYKISAALYSRNKLSH